MPSAEICIDCGRTVQSVSRGRCPACLPHARAEQNARYGDRTGRMTDARRAHQVFKDSPAWRKVRKQIRMRDGACVDCGTDQSLTVHHVVPYRTAPELALDPDNLVTLCRSCHGRREARGV
jgi:5-methylcytosine-specific restriction endonuclease McrA